MYHHRTVYSTFTRTFYVSENYFSSNDQITSLEHVVARMSLYVRGYPYSSEFDYDDFYDAIYDYYYDIDRIYDWLQSPHPRRGDIKIELTSPHGTTSVLLPYRNYDFVNEEGYDDWPFMSVHFWGENPVGTWTLKITFKSGSGYVTMSGLSMTLYGTATVPTAVTFNTPGMDAQMEQGHGDTIYNYAESDDKTNVLKEDWKCHHCQHITTKHNMIACDFCDRWYHWYVKHFTCVAMCTYMNFHTRVLYTQELRWC